MNTSQELTATTARKTHGEVVAHIGMMIVSGRYSVGSLLPKEEEFTEQLAAGRGVIREALRVLASKGLVEAKPRRGTIVLPQSEWQQLDPELLRWRVQNGGHGRFLRDLVETRALIEPAASANAAERATEVETQLISSIAREMQLTEGDKIQFLDADMRFHAAILQAAHNEVLFQVGMDIDAGLRLSRELTVSLGHSSRVAEHVEVADAIASRSPARARKAMSRLMTHGAEDIAEILDRMGSGGAA